MRLINLPKVTHPESDGTGDPNYWSKNETTHKCDAYYYYINTSDNNTVKYYYEGKCRYTVLNFSIYFVNLYLFDERFAKKFKKISIFFKNFLRKY